MIWLFALQQSIRRYGSKVEEPNLNLLQNLAIYLVKFKKEMILAIAGEN